MSLWWAFHGQIKTDVARAGPLIHFLSSNTLKGESLQADLA